MTHLTQGAIVTKRTSRHIVATCYNGSHRMAIDYSQRNGDLHAIAAAQLVRKLAKEWCKRLDKPRELINAPQCGQWAGGDMPAGDGYAFVYVGETNRSSGIEPRGFVQNCERAEF